MGSGVHGRVAVLGWILLVWLPLMVENSGPVAMGYVTMPLPDGVLKANLIETAPHLRLITLGAVLLLVQRFSPKGLLPQK